MVLKKRRNVREKGYMKNLKGDLSNVKLAGSENEDICWQDADMVAKDITVKL